MIKVAIIGTQGVPANYGGFETLAENLIGENCSSDIQYTVFCSSKDLDSERKVFKNAELRYVWLHANGIQSIPFDIISMLKTVGHGFDVILILGVSGCIFLPVFRLLFPGKIIVNIDGLEHKRAKWGKFARRFLKFSEKMAVKHADVIIADNKAIQDYVFENYKKKAEMIAYGGDQVQRYVTDTETTRILKKYGMKEKEYAISICRIEPENNCHMILDAFAHTYSSLLFIGNWDLNEYGRSLKKKYASFRNIYMADSVYDLDTLFVLRNKAAYYIHGHSAGGTNPSLVEAMHFSLPILAYGCLYNRETTEGKALYFTDEKELTALILQKPFNSELGKEMKKIADKEYTWEKIAKKYESLY